MSETERASRLRLWELAVLALQDHGEAVGDILLQQFRTCLVAGDATGAAQMMEISGMVQQLMGPDDDDHIQ